MGLKGCGADQEAPSDKTQTDQTEEEDLIRTNTEAADHLRSQDNGHQNHHHQNQHQHQHKHKHQHHHYTSSERVGR